MRITAQENDNYPGAHDLDGPLVSSGPGRRLPWRRERPVSQVHCAAKLASSACSNNAAEALLSATVGFWKSTADG